MPICLEFSTLKSFDNFLNVSSLNALLQWWYHLPALKKSNLARNIWKIIKMSQCAENKANEH